MKKIFEVITVQETRTLYMVEATDEARARSKATKGRQRFVTRVKLKPYVAEISESKK